MRVTEEMVLGFENMDGFKDEDEVYCMGRDDLIQMLIGDRHYTGDAKILLQNIPLDDLRCVAYAVITNEEL